MLSATVCTCVCIVHVYCFGGFGKWKGFVLFLVAIKLPEVPGIPMPDLRRKVSWYRTNIKPQIIFIGQYVIFILQAHLS